MGTCVTRGIVSGIPSTVGSGFLSSPTSGRGAIREAWRWTRSVCGGQDRWARTRQVRIRVFVCRSVPGLDRPTVSRHFLLALSKPAMEQVQHVPEALAR